MSMYNNNQPEFYFNIGNEIVKEGIFERLPELRPAIGGHFWREDGKHKKMLLIGESNYFDDNDIPISDFLNAEKWYKAKDAKLIPEYARTKVSNWIGDDYPTFKKFFKIIDEVLDEAGIDHFRGLEETGFYNYFLRPAHKKGSNKGFKPENIDREVSGIALSGILERLNPDLVIFLSKKAYAEFEKFCNRNNVIYKNIVIKHVSHPASIWWYRNGGDRGKKKFEQLLKDHWLISKQEL